MSRRRGGNGGWRGTLRRWAARLGEVLRGRAGARPDGSSPRRRPPRPGSDGPAGPHGGTPHRPPPGPEMECGLCGRRFREDRGQPACRSCPLARACRFVRCPGCGYENPVTPGWLRRQGAGA